MSFIPAGVDGYAADWAQGRSVWEFSPSSAWGEAGNGTPYLCEAFECLANRSVTNVLSIATADILAMIPAPADYYSLAVIFAGPQQYAGGYSGCSGPVCDGYQGVTEWTAVDGGDYVNTNDVACPTSGITGDGGTGLHQEFELGRDGVDPALVAAGGSYLVNPSPDLAVPDGANTFGKCLFTEAQLPAAISVIVTVDSVGENAGGGIRCQFAVGLRPYRLTEPAATVDYSHIIGCA